MWTPGLREAWSSMRTKTGILGQRLVQHTSSPSQGGYMSPLDGLQGEATRGRRAAGAGMSLSRGGLAGRRVPTIGGPGCRHELMVEIPLGLLIEGPKRLSDAERMVVIGC
ncbi:hypothetical protein AMTR_s00015p00218910 [Amborella trichopoda]|uniref:Uncharacterized protein n=1 Tax=Amborella trichopoda TaxID=13333 RepID=W1PFX2_AMBTC|nr:hypothetical protein AMTR_s00015p00218910 [Amborella trichopoda]